MLSMLTAHYMGQEHGSHARRWVCPSAEPWHSLSVYTYLQQHIFYFTSQFYLREDGNFLSSRILSSSP